MSLARSLARGTAALGGGYAGARLLAFARNVVLARVLATDEFGLAMTLVVMVTALELLTNLAPETLVVQDRDGDDPHLLRVGHSLQLARGIAGALLLVLLAQPLAALFGAPQAGPSFRWLALVPLIQGLRHLDVQRLQRRLAFGPAIASMVVADALALLAAWPLAEAMGDHRAVLWLLVVRAVGFTAVTHLAAERRYALGARKDLFLRYLAFGWPLLANGVLMLVNLQADRVIVAGGIGLEAIALYSVAAGITSAVAMTLAQVNRTLVLPVLAAVQEDGGRFRSRYEHSVRLLSLVGGAFAVGAILLGGPIVVLVYGERYAAAAPLVGWFGAQHAVRLLRSAPSQAAVAAGDTRNPLFANAVRAVALPLVLVAALQLQSLVWVAVAGFAGEVAAFAASVARLQRRHGLRAASSLEPTLLGAAGCLAAAAAAALAPGGPSVPLAAAGVLLIVGAMLAAAYSMTWFTFRPEHEGIR